MHSKSLNIVNIFLLIQTRLHEIKLVFCKKWHWIKWISMLNRNPVCMSLTQLPASNIYSAKQWTHHVVFDKPFKFKYCLTKLELPLHDNRVQLTNQYSQDYDTKILILSRGYPNYTFSSTHWSRKLMGNEHTVLHNCIVKRNF